VCPILHLLLHRLLVLLLLLLSPLLQGPQGPMLCHPRNVPKGVLESGCPQHICC
jgi:hypothetical protein